MTVRGAVTRALTAVAVVAAVAAPAPALAAEPLWQPAPCFSGAIDSVEVTDAGQDLLTLAGHLDCAPRDKDARFGYARYGDGEWGLLRTTDLRRYGPVAPTLFAEGRYVEDGAVSFTLCVVTDRDVQVDCVQVTRAEPGAAVEVARDLKMDGLYGRPVRVVEGDHRPACGGCW